MILERSKKSKTSTSYTEGYSKQANNVLKERENMAAIMKFIMIVTKLLVVLLLVLLLNVQHFAQANNHHQLFSASASAITDNDDDHPEMIGSNDEVHWQPASQLDNQESSIHQQQREQQQQQHHKRHHHHHHSDTRKRWKFEEEQKRASIIDDPIEDQPSDQKEQSFSSLTRDNEADPVVAKLPSEIRGGGPMKFAQNRKSKHHRPIEQQHQQHGSSYVAINSKDRFWHNNGFHNHHHHHHHHHQQHNHHQQQQQQQHTDWCSRDCQQQLLDNNNNSSSSLSTSTSTSSSSHHRPHVNRHSICASDGRLYKSMCELKRHSCRHNVRLRRRPRTFCSQEVDAAAAATNMIVGTNTNTRSSQVAAATAAGSSDKVRIVELKKLCDSNEYNQMKNLMFNEFNGDLRSMFRYYDVDADNYIEAHELWPKNEQENNNPIGAGGGRLIYAQVWDNHTSKCPQNDHDNHGDHSGCWYFLDFAFQPKYMKNSCSLSHMMLFDLKHPNHRFDYDDFARAFSNFTDTTPTTITTDSTNGTTTTTTTIENRKNIKLVKKTTKTVIGLGDNIDLICLGDLSDEKNHVINGGDNSNNNNNNNNNNGDDDGGVNDDEDNENDDDVSDNESLNNVDLGDQASSKCTWTRYNSNLAASKDPHISISEQRIIERNQRQITRGATRSSNTRQEIILHIDEAQPYLDGQYKCLCHIQESSIDFEHTYHLQVLAKPRTKVSPRSRTPFECQYDQINSDLEQQTTISDRQFQEDKIPQDNSPHDEVASGEKRNQDEFKNERDTPVNEKEGEGGEEMEQKPQLWIFHENGISIYRIQNDDGQEMELIREINGHNSISAQVEDNWNQLTLCGGLNSEQAVICEWSDNAVFIDVDRRQSNFGKQQSQHKRKYIYVGQPNLNRVLVFDSIKFEIVAIINTEPQPRKLHLYEPNKIHLSKWVKRRLSPIANARWQSAIGTRAHLPESTPQQSRLYSSSSSSSSLFVGGPASTIGDSRTTNSNVNQTIGGGGGERTKRAAEPLLIQHDIWLLCYGQPLVPLDPSSGSHHREHSQPESAGSVQSADSSSSSENRLNESTSSSTFSSSSPIIRQLRSSTRLADSIKPFEPRLSSAAFPPFAWPSNIWSASSLDTDIRTITGQNNDNKEARLRNRKSVHIIQSTFLPMRNHDGSIHTHAGDAVQDMDFTSVDEFKRTSVISTHHIYPGSARIPMSTKNHFHFGAASPSSSSQVQRVSFLTSNRRGLANYDLIQDLFVPQKPFCMRNDPEFRIHYAYVTHYDERRLFRVSMDNYRYDREIDLQDCDPIHMLTTAQGLVVVQCRAPISHSLIGQLVLDQLTTSRIEFNVNIRAQESHLSPDNRYLVSIFHNTITSSTATTGTAASGEVTIVPTRGQRPGESFGLETSNGKNISAAAASSSSSLSQGERHQSMARESETAGASETQRHSSIVYVQTVTIDGLRFQYEIKTSFEISQCSFVWKDGYYAAIFVTTNRKDQQSEILSLRLKDSRLELMARVPGLVSSTRHKEQLIVLPELRLAALTTDQGTFVIDLEENRVSQSLRPRHPTPPTLLWV